MEKKKNPAEPFWRLNSQPQRTYQIPVSVLLLLFCVGYLFIAIIDTITKVTFRKKSLWGVGITVLEGESMYINHVREQGSR